MRLIAELRADHDLIEAVLGSLRTYVVARVRGGGAADDAARFVSFFRRFATWHHEREEDVLFPALINEAELPQTGPLATLCDDHRDLARVLGEMEAAFVAGDLPRAQDRAIYYSRTLWSHIDAENSVLLPESERCLRRAGVFELDGPPPTPDQEEARADAQALLREYPPTEDRAAMRGDGCMLCPALGQTCRGLEQEWWNEHEWDAARSGDFSD
jgi:hemerythrin-like domain-containing protein